LIGVDLDIGRPGFGFRREGKSVSGEVIRAAIEEVNDGRTVLGQGSGKGTVKHRNAIRTRPLDGACYAFAMRHHGEPPVR
jgi:hypothetical protein